MKYVYMQVDIEHLEDVEEYYRAVEALRLLGMNVEPFLTPWARRFSTVNKPYEKQALVEIEHYAPTLSSAVKEIRWTDADDLIQQVRDLWELMPEIEDIPPQEGL